MMHTTTKQHGPSKSHIGMSLSVFNDGSPLSFVPLGVVIGSVVENIESVEEVESVVTGAIVDILDELVDVDDGVEVVTAIDKLHKSAVKYITSWERLLLAACVQKTALLMNGGGHGGQCTPPASTRTQ